jgi:ABC-type antimicrobial peptide transport system permease subunit
VRNAVSAHDVATPSLFIGLASSRARSTLATALTLALADAASAVRGAASRRIDVAAAFAAGTWPPSLGGWSVTTEAAGADAAATTAALLDMLFAALTLVALLLCFFALIGSVAANLAESRGEAGILRAIGLSGARLVRIFALEAFAVVVAASLAGVGIGAFVAWTFGQQQALFTAVEAPFATPTAVIVAVVVSSAIAAIAAASAPARRLARAGITKLLRGSGGG